MHATCGRVIARAGEEAELNTAMIFNSNVHEDEILMYPKSDENLSRKFKILEKIVRERSRRETGDVRA